MNKRAKDKIYKTCIRLILTYAIEIRAGNKKTRLRTTEIKIRRNRVHATKKKKNAIVRNKCEVQVIAR